MVLGDSNGTGTGSALSTESSMRSFMIEEHLTDPGTANTNMLISEALVPRLISIAHEAGEAVVAAAAASGSDGDLPSGSPSFRMEMANSSLCGEQILSNGRAENVVIGIVLTLLTFITICGNLLVVISVCFVKKLRQPSNYLIVSLALADLSVALAVMPFVSITDLIGGRWIFGQFFCNVFIAMDVTCCTASIMTLCVISIDR